ncbi:MAG TPA: amino acid adenylation domain-containing protein, partial [Solirubrobacterales bacterium]|nr:amino acid adenylation domain-containing protein [Solirubrobacterales bacterium]
RLGPGDTVLQKTPIGFDVSVWELLWPLLAGARLHLAAPEGHLDPRYLAETVIAEEVTTVHFVPSMLALFLEQPLSAECASLRRVLCSGEALSPPLMRRALAALAPARLFNLYGPTEASIDVTCWRCEEGAETVPIGRPIANVDCYVVDEDGERVGVGESGELCIGGVQVGHGYVGQPQATAERFVELPWAPGTVYRTGDVVRWSEAGLLEYLGRVDRQLKLNGLRIEPGEIEALIEAMPGVTGAAVVLRSDLGAGERLVAYVAGARAPEPPEIRRRLYEQLPLGMVPSFLVGLEAMPVTANGKLDLDSLPRPEAG